MAKIKTTKYNILFVPDKEKDRDDVKLRLRIRWNGQTVNFGVGYRVNLSKWSSEAQRCKANTTHGKKHTPAAIINNEIQRLEGIAADTFNDFHLKGIVPTVEEYKAAFNERNGKKKKESDIFAHYEQFIVTEKEACSWTEATVKKHRTILAHLRRFAPELEYTDLDEYGISLFVDYLLGLGLRNTTVKKDVKILHWFIRWAAEKGHTTSVQPHVFSVKLKTIPKKVIFLTWEELMKLNEFPIPATKNYLRRVRDKFLFCCFTSLRYSDMGNLRWKDVGRDAIQVVTIKTDDPLIIELNDYSRSILERQEKGRPTDYVFSRIGNQKMNGYLKELCCLAGIDTPVTVTYYQGAERMEETRPKYELVTTHTGRRSFICNALMLGISPTIVMKWTGHSDYASMKPYIDIADEAKKSAMSLFNVKK